MIKPKYTNSLLYKSIKHRQQRSKKEKYTDYKEKFSAVLLMLSALIIYTVSNGIASIPIQNDNVVITDTITSELMYIFIALVAIHTIKKMESKESIKKNRTYSPIFGAFKWSYIKTGVLTTIIAIITTLIAKLGIQEFTAIDKRSDNQSTIIDMMQSSTEIMLWVIIVSCILAPLCEELIFRRIIIGSPMQNANLLLFRLVMSCVIFTGIHITSETITFITEVSWTNAMTLMNATTPYLIMAIAFAYVYYKYQTLWVSLIAHITNNILSTIIVVMML